MLPIYILSKYNIRPSNLILSQWINITVRACTSSSNSSSSDSDSDEEKIKPKQMNVKSTDHTTSNNEKNLGNFMNNNMSNMTKDDTTTGPIKGAISLMDYVNNMMTARKLEKTIDVAIPKKKLKDLSNKNKHVPYEKRLTRAAEDVANTLGGDKTKTTSDLLEKVLASEVKVPKKKQLIEKEIFPTLDSKLQRQRNIEQSPGSKKQENFQTENYSKQKSVIHSLLDEYKKRSVVENSISRQLLNQTKAAKSSNTAQQYDVMKPHFRGNVDLWNGKPSDIFDNMGTASPHITELKTWTALQERELKTLTIYPSANIFQEMILWTEQGKLWKFPIDNEQGMEEEHNVHFSEHVFMERHLKGWCPKSGPIRHFMELVCTGLSKNPYMTVEEKINHIMWYREYFGSKQDLLQELGAIQEPFPDKVKEIQE